LTQWLIDRHLRPNDPPAFQLPQGMPLRMMTYDKFSDERGWDPRVVDELYDDELFWLPVIKAAKTEAARQVAAVEAAQAK
jgi:hypothetical protein